MKTIKQLKREIEKLNPLKSKQEECDFIHNEAQLNYAQEVLKLIESLRSNLEIAKTCKAVNIGEINKQIYTLDIIKSKITGE